MTSFNLIWPWGGLVGSQLVPLLISSFEEEAKVGYVVYLQHQTACSWDEVSPRDGLQGIVLYFEDPFVSCRQFVVADSVG